jgi:NRPS condensation-like uncharacterized protein
VQLGREKRRGGIIFMGKQYVSSERAHFMCPNMHFGILVDVKAEQNSQKIKNCFDNMAQAHPFLRSVIAYEKGTTKLYYKIEEESKVQISERESKDITEDIIWEDYKSIATKEWNVLHQGLLKVYVYPAKEGMKVLFVAHHLLGDGRCLLELMNEFVNLYVQDSKPGYAPERLIQGTEDLPEKSKLSGMSKYLVKNLNRKWRKENHRVSYDEYAKFARQFVKENPVFHEAMEVGQQEFNAMKIYCVENNITMNDLLMSQAYESMNVQKIVIAADSRSKLPWYHQGACGNYATAVGIVYKGKHRDDLMRARHIHMQVKKYMESNRKLMLVLSCYLAMENDLIDAVAIATLGDFKSKTAKFVGGNMFGFLKRDGVSVTNLGKINNPNIWEATFIPPASPAMIQTIGVLTVNDKMRLCSSYYENSISRPEVKKQLALLTLVKNTEIN